MTLNKELKFWKINKKNPRNKFVGFIFVKKNMFQYNGNIMKIIMEI